MSHSNRFNQVLYFLVLTSVLRGAYAESIADQGKDTGVSPWQPYGQMESPDAPKWIDLQTSLIRGQYDEPLVTDRPDFTEASSTVGQGVVQLEMGYTFVHDDDNAGETTRGHTLPESLFRIGVTDSVELRLFWTYEWEEVVSGGSRTNSDGGSDLEIGTKIELFEACCCRPEQAMIVAITTPTGADAFSTGEVEFIFNYLYSWELANEWSLAGSTGYTTDTEIDSFTFLADRSNVFFQSVALGIPLTDCWGMYIEYFGLYRDNSASNAPQNFIDGGITYLLNCNVQFDVRGGVGLNEHADDFFAGTGVTLRF